MAGDWSDEQNDAIIADYFAMLTNDIIGPPYSKAERNRLLQAVINRPRASIEYKHQNINAVLMGLGEDWIPGSSSHPPSRIRDRTSTCAICEVASGHAKGVTDGVRAAVTSQRIGGERRSAVKSTAGLHQQPDPRRANGVHNLRKAAFSR